MNHLMGLSAGSIPIGAVGNDALRFELGCVSSTVLPTARDDRFSLEAIGIWALSLFGHDLVLFVILGGPVFFPEANLQPVPVDLYRCLRGQLRDDHCLCHWEASGDGPGRGIRRAVCVAAVAGWRAASLVARAKSAAEPCPERNGGSATV